MTIEDYLDKLQEALDREFLDQGRQMSLADLGKVYCVASRVAAEHAPAMRALPYEVEQDEGRNS